MTIVDQVWQKLEERRKGTGYSRIYTWQVRAVMQALHDLGYELERIETVPLKAAPEND